MNNFHKYKNLSPKVQAIKRNEQSAKQVNVGESETTGVDKRSIIKKVRRITLRVIGDMIHLQDADPRVFEDLFVFYKEDINEIHNGVDTENEAWPLLQELTANGNFLNEEPIQSRQELSRRIDELAIIIDKFID